MEDQKDRQPGRPGPQNVSGERSNGAYAKRDAAEKGLPTTDGSDAEIRQYSDYDGANKPVPDNNPFWENGGNPLSSKGN
ncbi:hypothetical protein [Qiania dongpingensis]|uniref:Uncharacterized protein n=1 Tax=Qiania dongpingensis TaxID=2763669 RepID=A0A7G9G673_9FIRM|nr:hypothetical protein [Qiania dongpingensis]QNM06305.1 hypothetical protein H9Q78_03960 [Qiania dongpingensis]